MRVIINIIVGLLLIIGAFFIAKSIISGKEKPHTKSAKVVKTVFIDTVLNGSIQVKVPANGNLKAVRRIELYAEVQGVFNGNKKLFKAGETYQKGELLVSIDGKEYYANIVSQRSNLYNQITAIMPDLKLDYPIDFSKWESYLKGFDIKKSITALPEPSTEKVKYFINGKNITSLFFTIKNMEEHYSKFQIYAPFSGVLTEASVNPGTLIRTGQKLGEFIDPSVYELEVAVNKSYSELLKVGKEVALSNIDKTKTWKGKVARVNGRVDLATQTVAVFIAVKDKDLKEGMYLEAQLDAQEINNAIEIPRKLLVDGSQVYTVNNGLLELKTVQPIYFTKNTVVLKGLENGTFLLEKAVPGAYENMSVNIHKATK